MKDVAILTKFYKNYNYGGMLQGYALNRVISKLGYSVDLIAYDVTKNKNSVYPNIISQAKQYGLSAAAAKIGEKAIGKGNFLIKDLLAQREKKFIEFMLETASNDFIYNDDTMHLLKDRYKAFVSGSDQVWNPNAVRNLFLQTFSVNRNRKISYAASIGRERFSQFEAKAIIPSLRQFGSISVREKTAKDLLKQYIDAPISTVLDPTLLLTTEEWAEIAAPRLIKNNYALAYFFSDSYKIRLEARRFCNKHNLQLVFIPYAKQEYNITDMLGPGIRVNNLGPCEFVSLISHASFVLTDSFHGAAFSLIHRVPFAVFERNKAGHVSMNSRLYDLLNTFDESNRLIEKRHKDDLDKLLTLDNERIQNIINKKKKESLLFLKESIEKGIKEYERDASVPTITGQECSCSGCGACVELCPTSCISLKPNNNGFIVPIINQDNCISCGKCRKICPMLGSVEQYKPQKVYAAYSIPEEQNSTSGGISIQIARHFINAGGVVYGAAYDEDLRVRIRRAQTEEELTAFQGSKYVQAEMADALSQVAGDLKAGRNVLFSGTPCEIAGLKAITVDAILKEHLYTVEIICHGVPSPKMFSDYLSWAEGHYGKKITSYTFRAKKRGKNKDFMTHIGFLDGSTYEVSGFKDPYYKLFLSSRWFRECCYECPFAVEKRVADVTLGDFWNAEKLSRHFEKGRRVSVILTNSDKGQKLMEAIVDKISKEESTWNVAKDGNTNLYRSTRKYSGYVGYGAINEKESFFEKELYDRIDYGKYLFNQLPLGVRRTIKRMRNRK